jgi:hypothetical protein
MSISVQELDNTVRALFEGKGEIVSDSIYYTLVNHTLVPSNLPPGTTLTLVKRIQQNQAQQTLTEVSAQSLTNLIINAS